MGKYIDIGRSADSFDSIEAIEAYFKEGIEYWDDAIKRASNDRKKAEYMEAKDCTIYMRERRKEDFIRLQNKDNPFFIDHIKAQARADFEEWKEKVIFEATTGKEYKKERGRVIEMYPHV